MRSIMGLAWAIASLATILSGGPAMAGVVLNGTSFNGLSLNGVSLNGVSLNGVALNGTEIQGSTQAARAADPSALAIRSIRLPDGRVLHASAK